MARITRFCLRLLLIAVGSAALAVAMMVLAFALNIAALSAGPARVKASLARAIDDGTLLDRAALDPLAIVSIPMGREINIYSLECFLWTTVLADPPGGVLTKVLRTPRLDAMPSTADLHAPPSCTNVVMEVTAGAPARPRMVFYDRYILGQRAIAQFLLENFSVRTSTLITKFLTVAGYMLVLVLAWRKGNAVITSIAAVFLLFGGLNYFGAVLYFSPLDLAHIGILLVAIYLPFGTAKPAQLMVIGALYGAVIAIFEFLAGGIPMALVLLALITGISAKDSISLLKRYAILAFSFMVAVATCFAIKTATVAALYDLRSVTEFQTAFVHRLRGDSLEAAQDVVERFVQRAPALAKWLAEHVFDVTTSQIAYLVINYGFWSFYIGWGSELVGTVLVVGGLASLIVVTFCLHPNGSDSSPELLSCWLGFAVLPTWVLLFWNHTIVHPFMMARLLLVPVLCGCVAASFALRQHVADMRAVAA